MTLPDLRPRLQGLGQNSQGQPKRDQRQSRRDESRTGIPIVRKPKSARADQWSEGKANAKSSADQRHTARAPLRRGAVGNGRLSRAYGSPRNPGADSSYEQEDKG